MLAPNQNLIWFTRTSTFSPDCVATRGIDYILGTPSPQQAGDSDSDSVVRSSIGFARARPTSIYTKTWSGANDCHIVISHPIDKDVEASRTFVLGERCLRPFIQWSDSWLERFTSPLVTRYVARAERVGGSAKPPPLQRALKLRQGTNVYICILKACCESNAAVLLPLGGAKPSFTLGWNDTDTVRLPSRDGCPFEDL